MFDERADGGIQPRPDPRDVGTGVLRVSRRGSGAPPFLVDGTGETPSADFGADG